MVPAVEIAARDVTIPVADGLRLHARQWSVPDPRGVIVVAHGFGEHGGCYDHVARAVGPAIGVDFVAPDFRGHGLSPGRRGVVRRYDDLTADLNAALEWASRERPHVPCFLLGHSNGGQVALRAVLEPATGRRLAGLIVSNPSLKLATHVPAYKLWLGWLLLHLAPGLTLSAPLPSSMLTRDPAMQTWRDTDPLCHSRMSAPLFFGLVDGGQLILQHPERFLMPVLMILGGSDPVIDAGASRVFFDRLAAQDKTLLFFPDMLHEPFNELGREEVFAGLNSWVERHLPAAGNDPAP
jgi:alpha-beta hydrolase superfamily lysophospholipase